MSWPALLTVDETEHIAEVILEGTVLYSYNDLIPSVDPPIRGTHYLFKPEPRIVRSTAGTNLAQICREVGFWTLQGEFPCAIGASIRVALVRHHNRSGHLVLMPVPCSSCGVVYQADGTSLHRHAFSQSEKLMADRITDPPFRLETWIPGILSTEENPMNTRLFGHPGLGLRGDAYAAFDLWRSAWTVPSNGIQFVGHNNMEPPPGGVYWYATHFRVTWASIPPIAPGLLATWAHTYSPPVPDSARFPYARDMVFNTAAAPWSEIDQPATSDQGDFQTILAHEIGHGLGIGHLDSPSNSVMAETIARGQRRPVLQTPERNVVTNLYP